LVSSWYWPPQTPLPGEFRTLVEHIRRTRVAYVILGDMNAHSLWWGHADTDGRGGEMEELVTALQAVILNHGAVQTFQGARGSTAIDVSLVSSDIAALCPTWQCGQVVSHSDHLRIDIHLRLFTEVRKQIVRNINKTDWPKFQDLIRDHMERDVPVRWTPDSLDRIAEAFGGVVRQAWEEATPVSAEARGLRYTWWTDDLQLKKKEVQAARHRVNDSAEAREHYLRIRTEYARLLRTTRQDKWKDFTSASKTVPLQAKLLTVIHHTPRQVIGALKRGNDYTDNGDDSVRILLQEHFPEHKGPRRAHGDGRSGIYQAVPWIQEDLLRKAINKFAAGKRAGPDGIRPEMLKHLPDEALTRLVHIYRMVLTVGYTPGCWKEAEVIFLPKPNKA